MGTALVIILPPVINRFPGMKNIAEPVFIQILIAKASVKTLNKSVLRWLTWQDKPSFHTMLKGPLIDRARGGGKDSVRSCRFSRSRRKISLSTLRTPPGRHTHGTPYTTAADWHHARGKRIIWGHRKGRQGLRHQRADARNGGAESGQ